MLFLLLIFSHRQAYSYDESVVYSLESQVSDIRKTIEHTQSYLQQTPTEAAYLGLIESNINTLEQQLLRLNTSLQSTSSPSSLILEVP